MTKSFWHHWSVWLYFEIPVLAPIISSFWLCFFSFVCFSSFAISVEGLSKIIINTGQHILIEGYDEDNPYVAKVTRLYGDGESYSHKLGAGSANQRPDVYFSQLMTNNLGSDLGLNSRQIWFWPSSWHGRVSSLTNSFFKLINFFNKLTSTLATWVLSWTCLKRW